MSVKVKFCGLSSSLISTPRLTSEFEKQFESCTIREYNVSRRRSLGGVFICLLIMTLGSAIGLPGSVWRTFGWRLYFLFPPAPPPYALPSLLLETLSSAPPPRPFSTGGDLVGDVRSRSVVYPRALAISRCNLYFHSATTPSMMAFIIGWNHSVGISGMHPLTLR